MQTLYVDIALHADNFTIISLNDIDGYMHDYSYGVYAIQSLDWTGGLDSGYSVSFSRDIHRFSLLEC